MAATAILTEKTNLLALKPGKRKRTLTLGASIPRNHVFFRDSVFLRNYTLTGEVNIAKVETENKP